MYYQTKLEYFYVFSIEWLAQAQSSIKSIPSSSTDTPTDKDANFSVIDKFNRWRNHHELAKDSVVIRALATVISSNKASTMLQLEIKLKKASDTLKSWDITSISLTAVSDIFMRYVTRTSALEFGDFSYAKARLVERADKFRAISYKAHKVEGESQGKAITEEPCVVSNGSVDRTTKLDVVEREGEICYTVCSTDASD